MMDFQLADIHSIQATNVYCDHIFAIRALASAEGTHAAILTEEMVDDLFVESIILQLIATADKLEFRFGAKSQQTGFFRADRTVAVDHGFQFQGDFVCHTFAVTVTLILFFRHKTSTPSLQIVGNDFHWVYPMGLAKAPKCR
jgi:hypothetical protein